MTIVLSLKGLERPADTQPIDVDITYGDGIFTAQCETLHLITKADTFESLLESVWGLAPDMIETTKLGMNPDTLNLNFKFAQSAQDRRLALKSVGG
jgi:hypothetical protein